MTGALTIRKAFYIQMTSVAVVGAGLVGCLAALGLSKKGYNVTLFELRDGKCTIHLRY